MKGFPLFFHRAHIPGLQNVGFLQATFSPTTSLQ